MMLTLEFHISPYSKTKFKDLVRKACEKACFSQCAQDKLELSKGKELFYEIFEVQPYLRPESKLSINDQRTILHIRMRELDVRANFPQAHESIKCTFPCQENETQFHIFICKYFSPHNELISNSVDYKDIFGLETRNKMIMTHAQLGPIQATRLVNPGVLARS